MTDTLRNAILSAYRMDETNAVNQLLPHAALPTDALARIKTQATQLITTLRANKKKKNQFDSLLHEYDLSSPEGIALMCLAEALLRIPDNGTMDKLIFDKVAQAKWVKHLRRDQSFLVNTATLSLMLTGKVFSKNTIANNLLRPFILRAMKMIGNHFVMGQTIEEALKNSKKYQKKGYRYSYDMLGEAARTAEDAEKYFAAYSQAITTIGTASTHHEPTLTSGISIKLSALHPRYEFSQRERVLRELVPRVIQLAQAAKQYAIGFTIDAEEADRLDLSLDVIEAVLQDTSLAGWNGFGLAVQAYQKRAPFVIDWLANVAKRHQHRLMVRLVKGAYWDSEIKLSQLFGLEGYPVFTRKHATDVSYIACAKKLLAQPNYFYPQFGTHNAYTVAVILELAGEQRDFEFQCLHGMGTALYDQLIQHVPCRIYAPVGSHKELLAYLVRRLLENGANTSFVNHVADEKISIEKLIVDPVARMENLVEKSHPRIPLPKDIFMPERMNSKGIDLSNSSELEALTKYITVRPEEAHSAVSKDISNYSQKIPFETALCASSGRTDQLTRLPILETLLSQATAAKSSWANTPINTRADYLEHAANLFEKNIPTLSQFLCDEGGKTIPDCISEIRETVDYCRYYAARARDDFTPKTLKGPTGEYNQLSLHPRGLFICISPWNFPLAIFTGQVVAALVCGNVVIAKPAEQTPRVAELAVALLHEAGIPNNVLQLAMGRGETTGAALVADERIDGVMFTGSTETAKHIQLSLAKRQGPIIPFIAETGGQNAMIVDSSALPEQVVMDVMSSAFNSAGQRCSALRVLFLQEDIAPRIIEMLKGAMAELTIGDPHFLSTDIGPVIDADAWQMLQSHYEKMCGEATLIYQCCHAEDSCHPERSEGSPDSGDPSSQKALLRMTANHFFAPCAFELKNLKQLDHEVFGPILHIIRFKADQLDQVLDDISQTGYGLTLGIHSRIETTVHYIQERMPVGNVYVNRNMIGAVVGVQPFGGEGLSGTGPKAGGPHYLPRLCVERTLSVNTTAAGGNATLVSLTEDE